MVAACPAEEDRMGRNPTIVQSNEKFARLAHSRETDKEVNALVLKQVPIHPMLILDERARLNRCSNPLAAVM